MNAIDFHRAAIAFHQAEVDKLTGVPAASGFDVTDWRTWWPAMLEQFKNDDKPHAWRPWEIGTPPDQVGDGDKPDDDFLRAFEPMMRAAQQQQVKDSTGAVFFFPNIKARTGHGWLGVKRECLALVTSKWGQEWMAHPDNVAAGIVPKPAAVAVLVQQVMAG